jgi:outer membrane lipoprotein-sorting protein
MRIHPRLTRGLIMAAWTLMGTLTLGGLAGNKATADEPALSTNINDYVCSKLQDVTATMKVGTYDEHECLKINKDFGFIYRLKGDVKLFYKEVNKLRLDAQLGASPATLIVNQTTQYADLLGGKVHTVIPLGNTPGKRKTLLDVGMISAGYLAYTEAEFKRVQAIDGVPCAVFRISYRDKSLDTSHRLVWIDPKTKIVLKREEYTQAGKQNATFYYKNPKQVAPGFWFPSSIVAYNNENKRAGETLYRNVKINVGLKDSLFKL